jgi:hypothetical protein
VAPNLDLIFSQFKQLLTIMLLAPLAASIWMLIADWKRPSSAQVLPRMPGSGDALAGEGEGQDRRTAA